MEREHEFIGVNDPMVILDTHIAAALEVALPKKDDRTNVNADPIYIGKWMILSDQDMTALKHHVLSSAVMGTVFAALIATISDPHSPLVWRALLMGGILTGMQAALVAAGNVVILAWEWCWPRRGLVVAGMRRCAVSVWNAYVSSHIVTLDNGATVYVDGFYSYVIEAEDERN